MHYLNDSGEWWPEEREAARPPDRISVSEWAARHRVLGKHSAIKGPYLLEMVPFFVPVMDSFIDQGVNEIVVCKSAQIGGTDALLNVVGYYSDQDPSSVMVVLADQDTAEYVSAEKIKPMFKDSPDLARLYDEKEFNKDEIRLPNGAYIAMAWATSVAKLASRPIRIVILDEINKPGYFRTSQEANPKSLAKERVNTYPEGSYKIGKLSSPTLDLIGITQELSECDAVFDWHVPCPYCGQHQPLRWSRKYTYGFPDARYRAEDGTMHDLGEVIWEGGREASREQIIATACYKCGECGKAWNTIDKNDAVRLGSMVPRTNPPKHAKKIGFHINRLYSLFDGGRIEKLVEDFVDAVNSHDKKELQGFINSSLAEPWKQVLIDTSNDSLLKAKCSLPAQVVPQEAVAITAGIDGQKYGFWFVVRAWARDYTSWLIHYGFLGAWDDVEQLLFATYYPVDGQEAQMRIQRAALDIGGGEAEDGQSMTENAYLWLFKNRMGRGCVVWGTKGSSAAMQTYIRLGQELQKTPSGKPLPGNFRLLTLNTWQFKTDFFYRLGAAATGEIPGAYLHADVDQTYLSHITAEEKRINEKGAEEWVQIRKDNHLLDCEVMAAAMAHWECPGGGVNLAGRKKERPPAERPAAQQGNSILKGGLLPKVNVNSLLRRK